MLKIDLHLHSNYSDGSDSVIELLQNIKKSNVQIFSLTDHDTFDGCVEVEKRLPNNINFIRGIELTCQIQNIKCHILGYNYDVSNVELKRLIEKGKILRKQKLETRMKYLENTWNIILTDEELKWLYSRKSVVKTHLANVLVKRGLAETNVQAMKKYLDNCKTGNTRFDGKEAIKILKNAGAIAVWAHPLGGEGEQHIEPNKFYTNLEIMKNFGIQGLECFYSRYNLQECKFLYECALKNNLLVSGGSDYHGTNKERIQIGQINVNNNLIDKSKLTILKFIINKDIK